MTKESAIRSVIGHMGMSRANAQNLVESTWPDMEPVMSDIGDAVRARSFQSPVSGAQRASERQNRSLSKLSKGIYGTVTEN